MILRSNENEALNFVKSLGLDPNKVRELKITFEANQLVTVEVTSYFMSKDLKCLQEITDTYKLVKIE